MSLWARIAAAWRRARQPAEPHGVHVPPPPTLSLHPSVGPEAAAMAVERALDPARSATAWRQRTLARAAAPDVRPGPAAASVDSAHVAAAERRRRDLGRVAAQRPTLPPPPGLQRWQGPALRLSPPTNQDWQCARDQRAQQERR